MARTNGDDPVENETGGRLDLTGAILHSDSGFRMCVTCGHPFTGKGPGPATHKQPGTNRDCNGQFRSIT